MRNRSIIAAGVALVALGGCVSYPVYQPVPVARLTPAQSAALASQPVDPAERARYAAADAQVARDDQAAQTYTYAYPYSAPAPVYSYGYYGYPGAYYGGFYPWFPGLSLSLGFGGYYRGGYYHGGGYHGGGYHGGFRGHR